LIDNHISIHSLMYTYEGSLSAGCHFLFRTKTTFSKNH
jgi:hypothetical protein